MSKTTTLGEAFDEHMEKPEPRKAIIAKVRESALSVTIIHLSLFTNLFVKKFPKHEYLESTHELMQQVYIKMKTEPSCSWLFPGGLSIYSLKCIRCRQSITAPGSIGETLHRAPVAMLHHWDMIVTEDAAVPSQEVCGRMGQSHPRLAICTSTKPFHSVMLRGIGS